MSRLEALVRSFSRFRVLVIGDVMLDRYLFGAASRISPEAPVPVVLVERVESRPGGAANVAVNLRALGARVRLAGVVGEDEYGALLEESLQKWEVETHLVRDPQRPTIRKSRVIARGQHMLRLDFEDTAGVSPEVERELLDSLDGVDAVLLEDYDKGTITPGLIEGVRGSGLPVAVDPKVRNFRLYRGVWLLKPNLAEFRTQFPDGELEAAVREAREGMGLENLVVTLGKEGMLAVGEGGGFSIPALPREVYDVTGAGDTVLAVLSLALLAGAELPEAALLASIAGSIKVGKLGAAPVYPEELLAEAQRTWEGLWAKVRGL